MSSIRPLTPADEPLLLAVLRGDPHNNLFLIGNLLTLGMGEPDLEYWGCYSGDRLAGVLMRYRANWCLHDAGGADFAAMAAVLDDHPAGARVITGEYGLVSRLWEHVRNYEAYEDHCSRLAVMEALVELPGVGPARRANEDDVPGLVALYNEAGEMARDAAAVQRVLAHGRIFVSEEDGCIVAAALTNAETPELAMVGGVYTLPSRHNRGHATACMSALCHELLREGIQPCLFYDNPQAGSIYRRLGFREIGTWRLLRLRRTQSTRMDASKRESG
ncbi:MAG: GNAT family N-acetyltransferase [Anaerolineae bacterium]|jgi:GNAT superfamily N-acetyltransferase|nr:GNAT family N-acetyltransferase [Anaerolineae bacterium]